MSASKLEVHKPAEFAESSPSVHKHISECMVRYKGLEFKMGHVPKETAHEIMKKAGIIHLLFYPLPIALRGAEVEGLTKEFVPYLDRHGAQWHITYPQSHLDYFYCVEEGCEYGSRFIQPASKLARQ